MAEDWVIATGKTTSIREVVKMAFNFLDIELEFVGKGLNEKAFIKSCKNLNYQIEIGKEVLNIDPNYFRPNEVDLLVGDSTKAKNLLGWTPKNNLNDIISEMMDSDLKITQKEILLKEGGYQTTNYFQ